MDHQMTKDIGRKCSDDVGATMRRNIALVDDDRSAFIVATYGATAAIATASTMFLATVEVPGTPAQAAEAIWDILRPMIVSTLEGDDG